MVTVVRKTFQEEIFQCFNRVYRKNSFWLTQKIRETLTSSRLDGLLND